MRNDVCEGAGLEPPYLPQEWSRPQSCGHPHRPQICKRHRRNVKRGENAGTTSNAPKCYLFKQGDGVGPRESQSGEDPEEENADVPAQEESVKKPEEEGRSRTPERGERWDRSQDRRETHTDNVTPEGPDETGNEEWWLAPEDAEEPPQLWRVAAVRVSDQGRIREDG